MGHQLQMSFRVRTSETRAQTKIGALQTTRKALTKILLDKSRGLSADLCGSFTSTANFFSRKYKFSNCFH